MAGGGIGEAALLGAAIGGGSALVTGGDPLQGAILGGLTGGMGGAGAGAAGAGAAGATEAAASGIMANQAAQAATQQTLAQQGLLQSGLDLGGIGASPAMMSATATQAAAPTGIAALMPKTLGGRIALGLAGSSLGSALSDRKKYGTPEEETYDGPLSKFRYDPNAYTPYTYRPYADGGPVEAMSNANAVGANTGFPMAGISRGAYATPYQQPISQNVLTGSQDTRIDAYTGQERLAEGGIAALAAGGGISSLGGYSDGGRLLKGPGDGVSDSIPATIGGRQPARLADGEFVVPARIVSEIGNGSTDAGARELYKMMDRVQSARRKTVGKDKVAKNTRASKYLPA